MNHIFQTLGFAALLFGLTVAADKALNKTARKELGDYVKSILDGVKPSHVNVRNPLSFLDDVSPFSFKSAKISLIFSGAALFVVVYVQYFAFGFDFSDIFSDLQKDFIVRFLLFFIFMVIGNFFVDYISFTQTLVILRLANKTDSKKSLFVLFFTDLLATVNIFTFLYAAFLTVGIIAFFNVEKRMDYVVSIKLNKDKSELSNIMKESNIRDADKFIKIHRYSAYLKAGDIYQNGVSGYLISSFDAEPENMKNLLSAALLPAGSTGRPLESKSGKFKILNVFDEEYQFSGELIHHINLIRGIALWYSAAYLQTDAVQDNFIEVAQFLPGFQPIDGVRSAVHAAMLRDQGKKNVIIWCVDTESALTKDNANCPRFVGFVPSGSYSLSDQASNVYSIGGKLPLYTFLFTSLTLTILIYLSYISIFILTSISKFTYFVSFPISKYGNLEEYPVTFSASPLIILVTLGYWLVA